VEKSEISNLMPPPTKKVHFNEDKPKDEKDIKK